MAGYKSDPNTQRLATYCCMCGTALRDAKSVEMGIGPTCRKNTGFNTIYKALTERQRKNVNKLIHSAGLACEADDIAEVLKLADKIKKRGFGAVAAKVRNRFITIRILPARVDEYVWTRAEGERATGSQHDVLQVWTPYSPEFNNNRRSNRLRGRPCKVKTDHGKFHWEFKKSDGVLLMRVLAITFPGRAFVTAKEKVATIPSPAEFNAQYAGHGVAPIK